MSNIKIKEYKRPKLIFIGARVPEDQLQFIKEVGKGSVSDGLRSIVQTMLKTKKKIIDKK